jgi:hypothetical protein
LTCRDELLSLGERKVGLPQGQFPPLVELERAIDSRMPERSDVIDGTFELDEWWELPLWQSDFTFAHL